MLNEHVVKVSVCCMTYNHERYIEKCLEGILMQQTSFRFEVIIHDDVSTDGTSQILDGYYKKYPDKIRIVRPRMNRYSTGTRAIITTYLLPLAQGEYIALCEGDDYWTDPFKLQKQIDILEANHDYSVCIHAFRVVEEGTRTKIYKAHCSDTILTFEELIRWRRRTCQTATIVYRKEQMSEYPPFCLDCHVGDYPLMLWLASRGKVYYISDVMSAYRRGIPSSWTSGYQNASIEQRLALLQTELDMLDGFDEITNRLYAHHIDRKKRMLLIHTLWRYRDVKRLKETDLSGIFRLFPLPKALHIYFKVYFSGSN